MTQWYDVKECVPEDGQIIHVSRQANPYGPEKLGVFNAKRCTVQMGETEVPLQKYAKWRYAPVIPSPNIGVQIDKVEYVPLHQTGSGCYMCGNKQPHSCVNPGCPYSKITMNDIWFESKGD